MSDSDLYMDESCKWTLAQLRKNMNSHLFRLMEMTGYLESLDMVDTATKMREHITAVDDIFSLITDSGNDPDSPRNS